MEKNDHIENIVRKGEIACYKQFLLFSQCFPLLYIFNASNRSFVWKWVKSLEAVAFAIVMKCKGDNHCII